MEDQQDWALALAVPNPIILCSIETFFNTSG